jgi:hypothetical protein
MCALWVFLWSKCALSFHAEAPTLGGVWQELSGHTEAVNTDV